MSKADIVIIAFFMLSILSIANFHLLWGKQIKQRIKKNDKPGTSPSEKAIINAQKKQYNILKFAIYFAAITIPLIGLYLRQQGLLDTE